MKLSIITICYNDKAGFEKTAKSVVSQTSLTDVEWIIIDGASTDGSVDSMLEVKNSLINNPLTANLIGYFISEKDKGIYNAMNKGIRQAKGEYLLFMNSGDCIYAEDTLEKVMPLLKDKDVYVGDVANDTDGRLMVSQFPRELTPRVILDQVVFKLIPHQAAFIKRELFERYGLYREDLRIASDWYFFYDILIKQGASIECIPQPIAIFDMTGISSTDTNRVNERITSQNITPCQQELFCFYRDNVEMMTALKATVLGRMLMRAYFFIFRKLFNN